VSMRLRARAAAVLVLAGVAIMAPASPVAAAPPSIRIESVSSETVPSGGTVRVRFRATNNERRAETVFVAVSGGLRCTAGCSASPRIGPGRSRTFDATLVAPKVDAGQTTGLNLAVSVRVGTQTAFDHQLITVRGGGQAPEPEARTISGRVRDAAGRAISGVTLTVRDSAGHEYRTTSDAAGRFSLTSSDSRPITAGAVTIVARKDGYRRARATVRGNTVRLTMAAVAAPSKKPSPSPSPSASSEVRALADTEAPASSPPAALRLADDGEGNGTLLLMLLGGLLVAAGVGALVLMLLRLRRRPVSPAGAGGAGLADAPTAVLRAVPPQDGPGRGVRGGY